MAVIPQAVPRFLLQATLLCLAILAAYISFTLMTLPKAPSGISILSINKAQVETVDNLLRHAPLRLFQPIVFQPGRILWQPTTILPTYFGQKLLGPVGNYLAFSCLFIVTAFACATLVSRTLLFPGLVAFMVAFGTQLNYVYTFGSLISLYLVLTYSSINLTCVALLLDRRCSPRLCELVFFASLTVLALATEWWLNYATALLAGVMVPVAGLTLAYLLIRLRFPGQFTTKGAEEELLLTYTYPILAVEDLLANFLTFLYMTLDNYIPSFISSSNSLTRLGRATIIAQQNGYHESHQDLVVMSHLFLWRFYAGMVGLIYLAAFGWMATKALQSPARHRAIIVALMIMIMAGFSTHLMIKMRPYNTVPALSYKVIISVTLFTVLVAYVAELVYNRLATPRSRILLVSGICACVFLAALTRPGMQARLLEEVGLLGLRDPISQIAQFRIRVCNLIGTCERRSNMQRARERNACGHPQQQLKFCLANGVGTLEEARWHRSRVQ